MGSMAEKAILIEEDQDKEKISPRPTTPVSEGPTQLPVVMRSHPFGTGIENVTVYLFRRFIL